MPTSSAGKAIATEKYWA